jgi:hypothetical protein
MSWRFALTRDTKEKEKRKILMKGNENMNTNLVINTSKIRGYKNAFYAVSLILIFAISIGIAFAPTASAQIGVPQPEKTVGYISVAPTLVGVDQSATVNLWLFPIPTDYLYGTYDNGFSGISVTFTGPGGTTDTFKPVDGTGQYAAGETEATGSLYFTYAPNVAGNWSVSFTMPAQNITDYSGTVQYQGCTSNTATFTVQTGTVLAGLLNGYPWAALPNANVYWSYPINSNNREWSAISGDWLGSSNFGLPVYGATDRLWQPYGTAPDAPHIVWSTPLHAGGLIGGSYGSLSYSSAIDFPSAVVMDGMAFVNIPNENDFEGINLATGQILYTASGQITAGVHIPGNPFAQSILTSPGQVNVVLNSSYGSSPTSYLFSAGGSVLAPGTTWNYYDPYTGALMMSIQNASVSSYAVLDGTNLAYAITYTGQLVAWNLANVIANNLLTSLGAPATAIGNWPNGITWTHTLPPSLIAGTNSLLGSQSILGISADGSTIVLKTPNQYWGYSTKTGASVWNLTLNYPVNQNEEISLQGVNDFIVFDPTATTFHCYSMDTGALLWTSPSFSSSPWATTWTVYWSETNDYNNLYLIFPDGTIAALSLTTGGLVWHNTAIPSTEYTANAVPYVSGMMLAGGNIYAYAGYSIGYQINPIPRFAMMTCTNATTGDTTWTLNGGVFPIAASDGYILGEGVYDGNLYCIGQGPTSTTVTAQQQVGGSVLIQGSVLDKSTASFSATLTAMYANGVPAISDANMSVWMDYLHMQNATLLNAPPDCTGVPVTLTAISSTGTTVSLGTVTSDGDGHFSYQWNPTTAGLYTIYATFAGTNSYFESFGETSATVAITTSATATPTPSPTVTPTSTSTASNVNTGDLEMYLAIGVVVIVIAIAVVGLLILRKKP